MPTQVQRTASARRRLIAATRELVAAQGVGNTSVAAIGARAGMSRGAVNFHFGSKDDLLVAVSQEVTQDWEAQALADLGPATADADALVDGLVTAWLGELKGNPDRVRIVVMLLFEALGPSPHLHSHFGELATRVRSRVAEYLAAQQEAGRVNSGVDVEGFANFFVGVLFGVATSHLLDPSEARLDSTIAEARATLHARLSA